MDVYRMQIVDIDILKKKQKICFCCYVVQKYQY